MQRLHRIFIIVLAFTGGFSSAARAGQNAAAVGAVSLPAISSQSGVSTQTDTPAPTSDCTPPNTNPHCHSSLYKPPPHRPHYQRSRPVIINQVPAQPALEINSLTDTWTDCRKAKLGSIHARDTGDLDQANNLDEWLWKNCRSYSDELRQLEQDNM